MESKRLQLLTEHYQIMRAFINNTQKMLDILME